MNEQPQDARTASAAPTRRRALVVDDSRMVRRASRSILEEFGFAVTEAEDGAEALARIKAGGMPDLITLDWNMPNMSGIETLRALRAQYGDALGKVMFCTTNTDAIDIHKGIDAGATEWIVKPFDKPSMRAKLEKIGAI
ncbi:response regulator [Qipengyuania sp. RS5-5]|uniref:Response regulator n=1 Tax=Parerythrobacter lacustris TaxID=2969984 RepID=A0ABT1XR07_9SPHN|nr:response regulator [Parerythrobacter lacustris]